MKKLTNTFPARTARHWLLAGIIASFLFARPAGAEPAMWVIRDADSTIYLIGTLHLLQRNMEWQTAKVTKAVSESTELWLEVADMDDPMSAAPLIAQYGIDLEKPLSSKLNTMQNEKLLRIAATYGVPSENLEPMRPWTVGLLFSVLPLQKAGYDPNAGVDRILKTLAEKEGDKIRGFETAEQQMRFFSEMSENEQIAFLEEALGDAEAGIAQLEQLAKAWVDGDNEIIAKILVDDFKKKAPGIYEKLVVQRNVAWSEKIAGILKGSGVQQIAVGAAHLAGPDSLQVQLARRGIKVERY